MPRGTKAGKVLTCFLLLCISAPLVTEIALRYVLGLGNPVLIAPDSVCGYTLKPDQDIYRFFVHTHVNHWAMRSDDVPINPTPGTLRIIFLGDSITYGTSHVDQSDIFTGILHRELTKIARRPVEVLNASAGGWAIENELAYLRSRGTFGAALVVDVLNSGDLSQPPAELSSVDSDFFVKRPRTAIGELWDRFYPKTSRTDASEMTEARNAAIMKQNVADLDEISALAEKNRARFVLVYIPFRADLPLPSEESRKVFAGWARKNGATFVDLTDLEAQYQAKRITFDGEHLNKQGNRLAASYLETHLPLPLM
jgi:GDSL-like Lipase/Acylhydrolase family